MTYVVIFQDGRLAEAVAATLRTALFRDGRDDVVLVPALRGADFLEAERRRGEFSQATVIAREGEGADRLGRPGFLAVRPSRRGPSTRDGGTVRIPADTVDDLVRGIVAYHLVPVPIGKRRRTAFSLGGVLAIGSCLAVVPSQAAAAEPVHEATPPPAAVPLCVNEPTADPCFGYSPEEPEAEPLTPVRPSPAPPVDPFFPRKQYEDLKEANAVAKGMAGAIGRVVLGYSDGAGAYEKAEDVAKRIMVAGCAVWKPACLGVEAVPPAVGWAAGAGSAAATIFPEYVAELRKKIEEKWEEVKKNAQRPVVVPPGGYCNGPPGPCERPKKKQEETTTVTPSSDVTKTVPTRPQAPKRKPAPVLTAPSVPVQQPAAVPVAPAPSTPDPIPLPSYQDPMPNPVPAPAPSAAAQAPTYSSNGPTPYVPSGGGYQPPDYGQPAQTGGNGPGWGDAGVPPDRPGETVEVKPYPKQRPSAPGYDPLA
ncbi:hypothetical protein [Amycolatopsis sp. CA-230715]|uniref:hypothetical protein n=1 Tax=Amycolatopsis sp. CA-230715 TaxID=2745196 RepID=UPI001C010F7A|nr:hypothetical protein [Amycolatopsis sp. CA-230715]QWF84090.1 hypothetical protein HUW46_07534 [Amycolatopsis sp. CA-230715]